MLAKDLARSVCPPFLWNALGFAKRRLSKFGYSGNFSSFEEAMRQCATYDSEAAVAYAIRETDPEKMRSPVLDVRTMRLLAAMEFAFIKLGELRVLDFGGSLGGHYFLLRNFLPIKEWTVCELPRMVQAGRDRFATETLRFVETPEGSPNVILASGSLQYCEDPRRKLSKLLALKPDFLILDRVPILETERITIHKVPAQLFAGSFPTWFFGKTFFDDLTPHRVVMRWRLPEQIGQLDGSPVDAFQGALIEIA